MKDKLRPKHSQIQEDPKFQSKLVAEVDQGRITVLSKPNNLILLINLEMKTFIQDMFFILS